MKQGDSDSFKERSEKIEEKMNKDVNENKNGKFLIENGNLIKFGILNSEVKRLDKEE